MVALGFIRPQESSTMTDQRLWTGYLRGEIAFGAPNLRRNLCRLCVGLLTTGLKSPFVGYGANCFKVSGFYWDSLV